jgi:hypothetical protein
MIYIRNKRNNEILEIEPKEIWLSDKPKDVSEYSWNCERYLKTLSPAEEHFYEASSLEAYQEHILVKAKEVRINKLKVNRDTALVSNYISNQAIELTKNEDGSFTEGSLKYFAFEAKMVDNPASLPTQIVNYPSSAISLIQQLSLAGFKAQNNRLPTYEEFIAIYYQALENPNAYVAYSCDIIDSWVLDEDDNPTNEIEAFHKGIVKIDLKVASEIIAHAKVRNDGIIQLARQKIKEIEEATSISEVNSIEITF